MAIWSQVEYSKPLTRLRVRSAGLGWRFFVGAGSVLYFTQPTVKSATNNLVKAVTELIL